nr:MAG: hypothetical protein [Molluscum contagiosum virus]
MSKSAMYACRNARSSMSTCSRSMLVSSLISRSRHSSAPSRARGAPPGKIRSTWWLACSLGNASSALRARRSRAPRKRLCMRNKRCLRKRLRLLRISENKKLRRRWHTRNLPSAVIRMPPTDRRWRRSSRRNAKAVSVTRCAPSANTKGRESRGLLRHSSANTGDSQRVI